MENKIKELTDFYMWMVANEYDHNIRSRVENKAELYIKSGNSALSESQSVSDNETKEKLCAFFNGCPNFITDMSCSNGCGDYVEIAK
jgi:hypothetical protein